MNRAGRAVLTTVLVAVGVAGGAVGVASQPRASAADTYLTAEATRGAVTKSISDSGTVVDQYLYSVPAEGGPVLLQRDGETISKAGAAAHGSTVTSVDVDPGDTVDEDDLLAKIDDTPDEADDASTKITSPFDGRVRSVSAVDGAPAGEIITLGTGRVEVAITVSEYDVTRLKVDQNVDLALDASGATFDGRVASIAQTAVSSSGVQTYRVIIASSQLPDDARVGMTVTAAITVRSKADVITVPLTAVAGSGDETTVRVLGTDGTAETRDVTVGLVGDDSAEITKGLRAGETVITGTPAAGTPAAAAPAGPRIGG